MQAPRQCQLEAVNAFEKYFYENDDNDRGIISMCCGSGKTYTMFLIIKDCIQKHKEKFFIIATSRVLLIEQIYEDMYERFKISNIPIKKAPCSQKSRFLDILLCMDIGCFIIFYKYFLLFIK